MNLNLFDNLFNSLELIKIPVYFVIRITLLVVSGSGIYI